MRHKRDEEEERVQAAYRTAIEFVSDDMLTG